jgi:murein DD-endopeptidase
MRRWGLALLVAALASGCASVQRHGVYHVKPVSPGALVSTAKKEIGRPYRYGGTDPQKGFDCSGLVWWSYRQNGSSLPRSAHEQFYAGVSVARESVRAGDLVFFHIAGSHPPDHVGIVTKPPLFVHAPSTGGKVRENSLDEAYWTQHFFGARRID